MGNKIFPLSVIALALYGLYPANAQAQTSEQDVEVKASPSNPASAKQNTDEHTEKEHRPNSAVERISVTGSRLQYGDVTSNQVTISREEIKARGVTSVEELIRTLPQNLATIGNITNERGRGPLAAGNGRGRNAAVSQLGSLGVSAANLGGMGAGNTLILVNGRRMAGAAGIEDGFVNLNGIPLSAIERVEIHTDGASAIYGSDAMGGVINFILRKDHIGTTVNAQYENSSNGADSNKLSIYSGYSWGSGNISGTIDVSKRKPINNWKSGYVTEDYSGYYNGDPAYDRRSFSKGIQPGVIDDTQYVYNPETDMTDIIVRGITVPAGFNGRPTLNDMIELNGDAKRDFVPELAGPDTKSTSFTLNFDQELTNNLRLFATGLHSKSKNSQEISNETGLTIGLAPGQYYNPFPAYHFNSYSPAVTVHYYPGAELEAGLLPTGRQENTSTSWSFNTGLSYEFNAETKLDFIYTTSTSKSNGAAYRLASLVSLNADTDAPSGVTCYNFFLAENRYNAEMQTYYQDIFDRQCAALTSTNPDIAFNPWKSVASGSGGDINVFSYRDIEQDDKRNSKMDNFELRLNGGLFELPAGKIYYAMGGEYNDDGVDSKEVRNSTGESVKRTRHAYFAEFTVPVFSQKFNNIMAESLTLNIAARRDTYKTDGAIGTVNNIPLSQGGEIIYGQNKFAKTTPSLGFHWEPISTLAFRGKWTRGFKAPPYTNMFSLIGTTITTTSVYDPFYDCADSCDFDYGNGNKGYYVPVINAPNPDLKPQSSVQRSLSASWYPQGGLEGLTVDVQYNNTQIRDEYADRQDLQRLLPSNEQYALGQFYPRDETGKITALQNMIFNISGSEYSSALYEVAYRLDTTIGHFEPKITYLKNLKAEQKAFADSAAISTIGTLQGVDRYKLTGSLRYSYNDLTATFWTYYTPSYSNDYEIFTHAGTIRNPDYAKDVSSYITYDLTVTYQIMSDLRLNFAGRNLFDKAPPFVVVGTRPYDTARYNVAGRTLSLELQYEF